MKMCKLQFFTLTVATMLVATFAQEPDCSAQAPCTDLLQHLAPLQSSADSIPGFEAISIACGGAVSVVLQEALLPCLAEVSVSPGCPCNSAAACGPALSALPATCLPAMITALCEGAPEVDAVLKANLRSIVLHLYNDCTDTATPQECPATTPAFNETVCSADAAVNATAPAPTATDTTTTRAVPVETEANAVEPVTPPVDLSTESGAIANFAAGGAAVLAAVVAALAM